MTDSLNQYLLDNGFTYGEATDKYTWVNPTGESAPEAIKAQTIGTLIQTIMQECQSIRKRGAERAVLSAY